MARETAQLWLAAGADAETVARRLAERIAGQDGVKGWNLAANLEGSVGAAHASLDLLGRGDGRHLPALLDGLEGVERFQALCYQPLAGGCREPGLRDGIRRNLLLRVRDGIDPGRVAGLERDLARMPDYMPGIRNWTLGRVQGGADCGGWSHVWVQEYARLDDLMGEYLAHPYHWGWVDRWFDPDVPEWTVELDLCHAFCPLPRSLIGLET